MAVYPTSILGATDLIGGGLGAVDNIPTADLDDLDGVVAITDDGVFIYSIDSTSAAVENSPYVIKPDDEVDDKRLILQRWSESAFEAGTIYFFGQNAAPTGWTKKTDWTDLSMLVYTTGNISSGGLDDPKNWTTAITIDNHTTLILSSHTALALDNHSNHTALSLNNTNLNLSVSSHTLATSRIPSHRHSATGASGGDYGSYLYRLVNQSGSVSTNPTGGGSSHSHGMGGSTGNHTHTFLQNIDAHSAHSFSPNIDAHSFSQNIDAHTVNDDTFTPKYQTVIAATKD